MRVSRRPVVVAVVGLLLYAALGASFSMVERPFWAAYLPDPEQLPRWVGVILITMVGPAFFLALGAYAWPLYVGSLGAISVCLGLAWWALRRRPDSEVLCGLGILGAGAIWAASGWLTLVIGW